MIRAAPCLCGITVETRPRPTPPRSSIKGVPRIYPVRGVEENQVSSASQARAAGFPDSEFRPIPAFGLAQSA